MSRPTVEQTESTTNAPEAGPGEGAGPDPRVVEEVSSVSGLVRQALEFLIFLSLSILLFRTFAAEAYIVPTGSMAPTLLGNHRELVCPNCRFRFTMGLDEEGRPGRPVCPNCGQSGLGEVPSVENNGDRVLVQKFLYDVRRPRRWEVSVFHFPGDPTQAYVKRVVGLPGESVQVSEGNVLINGRIARKTLREQRATRILVYDNNFIPADSARWPRWSLRRGWSGRRLASGWHAEGTRFVHEPIGQTDDRQVDWVEYRHWDPDRARYAPVHDFNAYNGADLPGENVVHDLMFEARVTPGADARAFAVRIDSGSDHFMVTIPVTAKGTSAPAPTPDQVPSVRRNGRSLHLENPKIGLVTATDSDPRGVLLEASVIDRRLSVAIDGVPLFDPIDYDDPTRGLSSGSSPLAFGALGGAFAVSDIRIFRDVYYTAGLAFSPRQAFGIEEPYRLGPDEFFVLGDNSPVSNDSRFWARSPVVPGELFLGKPFLVHLPGQAVPLQVFGRSLYWVPDPREIRYIR